MAISINTNMMAINAARNLGMIYQRLGRSTESLASGLRIIRSADDPAKMVVRELMQTELAGLTQGLRNATDGLSLMQTADGALAVIDEKLVRMKELAEQAATATYTTVQRNYMNSEYQSLAAEIDRIANSTDFNGIKLLDGSPSTMHAGSGLKIHFGSGNRSSEDYYFLRLDDVRATASTGLRVGGDAANDIWEQGGQTGGCCVDQGVTSLADTAITTSGQAFSYAYNYDRTGAETDLDGPSYLAGVYTMLSGSSLADLVNAVNAGTQSRVRVNFGGGGDVDDLGLSSGGYVNVCLGDEIFQIGSGAAFEGPVGTAAVTHRIDIAGRGSADAAMILASAVGLASEDFWAMYDSAANQAFIFRNTGGNADNLAACDAGEGDAATAQSMITWTNMESWNTSDGGTTFALGGRDWAELRAVQDGAAFHLRLSGRDVGEDYDLKVLSAADDLGLAGRSDISGAGPETFTEVRDAANAQWAGGEIRSQSSAQEALEALNRAIAAKDQVRGHIGTASSRLTNTIDELTIKREKIQAAESTISDVDYAKAMTTFTKENIITQMAVSMLSHSNASSELALQLIL